jgi:hypothetical protein
MASTLPAPLRTSNPRYEGSLPAFANHPHHLAAKGVGRGMGCVAGPPTCCVWSSWASVRRLSVAP